MTGRDSDVFYAASTVPAKSGENMRAARLARLLLAFFCLCLALVWSAVCLESPAAAKGSVQAGQPWPSGHVSDNFTKDNNSPVRVIVRFKNPAAAPSFNGAGPRGKRAVFNRLRQRNLRSQAALSQYLSRNRRGAFGTGRKTLSEAQRQMHGLWIGNSIAINATPYEIEKLREDPDVAEVSQNSILSVQAANSASTDNAVYQGAEWNFDSIRLNALRAILTSNGAGVRIGQLDTGINPAVPDLQGKVAAWSEFDTRGGKVNSLPHETHYLGHGTDVAGIMVGEATGIAPGARLLCALVLPDGFGTVEQVLAGLQWVLDPDGNPNTAGDGADIVNMSFGVPGECMPIWEAVENMVVANVLPVAAIGNGGYGNTCSPGNAPGAIGVGALDAYDQVALFSGGGMSCLSNGYCFTKPDISAPGVNVTGLDAQGNYQVLTGTSLAAPHVSGVAALLKGAYPSITASQIRAFLLNSSDDLNGLGQDARYGWGKLDALASYEKLQANSSLLNTADLVVESSNSLYHKYTTFFADGRGSFLAGKEQELDLALIGRTSIKTLGVADVDGDGFADLVVKKTQQAGSGLYLTSYIVYLSLNGKGFCRDGALWYSFASSVQDPYDLIGIADVTGDRRADLVLGIRQPAAFGQYLYVLVFASTGESFRQSNKFWTNISYSSTEKLNLSTADVNGDGKADLVMARTIDNPYGWYPVFYWAYLSTGSSFQMPASWAVHYPNYEGGALSFFALADVNGDGRADLIVTGREQNDATPVYVCAANPYGFRSPALWAQIPAGASRLTAMGDVNGDGLSDIVEGTYRPDLGSYAFSVFLADKNTQSFVATQTEFPVPQGSPADVFGPLSAAAVGLGAW